MILEFIKTYWREILDVIAFVGALVLFIVKKKPVNSIIEVLDHACLLAVQDAEKTTYKGEEKLLYAVSLVYQWLEAKYPKLDVNRYKQIIVNTIEIILSTPQKKGENDGKKD